METCKCPFVWPSGDCVQCRKLASLLPGNDDPAHIMLPRKFEPLIKAFAEADYRKGRVFQASDLFTPRYPHACPQCVYLGRWAEYDLYFCSNTSSTVIARYGDDPRDYMSGLDFSLTPLVIAEAMAHRKGLL